MEHTSLISVNTACIVLLESLNISAFLCFLMHHRVMIAKVCANLVPAVVKFRNQSSISVASSHRDGCRLSQSLQTATWGAARGRICNSAVSKLSKSTLGNLRWCGRQTGCRRQTSPSILLNFLGSKLFDHPVQYSGLDAQTVSGSTNWNTLQAGRCSGHRRYL